MGFSQDLNIVLNILNDKLDENAKRDKQILKLLQTLNEKND